MQRHLEYAIIESQPAGSNGHVARTDTFAWNPSVKGWGG
jgi:hypothetical protein